MRLARWLDGGAIGEGFVIDDRVVAFPDGLTVADVLASGLDAAHEVFARFAAAAGRPIADVRLLAPLRAGRDP